MARILLDAICSGNVSLAKDIINNETYGGVDSQTSRRDGTALFHCCSRGYLDLAHMLLGKNANVDARDKCQATPLHAAADNNHLKIVQILLDKGANINAQTHRGDTALHLAAFRGHVDVAQCLVEHGADFQLANESKFTAAVEAMVQGHSEVGQYLEAVQDLYGQSGPSITLEPSSGRMVVLDPPSRMFPTNEPSQFHHLNGAFPGSLHRGLSYSNNGSSFDDVTTLDTRRLGSVDLEDCIEEKEGLYACAPMQNFKSERVPSSHYQRLQFTSPVSFSSSVSVGTIPWRRHSAEDKDNRSLAMEDQRPSQRMTIDPRIQPRNRKNCHGLSVNTTISQNPFDKTTSSLNQHFQRKHSCPHIDLESQNHVTFGDSNSQIYPHNNLNRHPQNNYQNPSQMLRSHTTVFHQDKSLSASPTSIGPRSRSPPSAVPKQPEESLDESMTIFPPPHNTSNIPSIIYQSCPPKNNDYTPMNIYSPPTHPKKTNPAKSFRTGQPPLPSSLRQDHERNIHPSDFSNPTLFPEAQNSGSSGVGSTASSFNDDTRQNDDFDLLPSISYTHLPPQQHHQEQYADQHTHPNTQSRSPQPSFSAPSPFFIKSYSSNPASQSPIYHRLPSTPSSIASIDISDPASHVLDRPQTQPPTTINAQNPTNLSSSGDNQRSYSPMSVEPLSVPEDSGACARGFSNGSALRSMETSAVDHTPGMSVDKDGDSINDLVFTSTMSSDEQDIDTNYYTNTNCNHHRQQRDGRWSTRTKPTNDEVRYGCHVTHKDRRNSASILNDLSSTKTTRPGQSLNYFNIPVGST